MREDFGKAFPEDIVCVIDNYIPKVDEILQSSRFNF